MTIYIVSAGRSGTGWLSSVLAGCGLKVVHEWTPFNVVDPDVVSNTEWLWNRETFLGALTTDDVVLVIDRNREDREASVNKLLGEHDWSRVDEQWEKLKSDLASKQWNFSSLRAKYSLFHIDYDDLFHGDKGIETVEIVLDIAKRDTSNLRNMWDFMRHMKVTNNTVEQMVKESYGL